MRLSLRHPLKGLLPAAKVLRHFAPFLRGERTKLSLAVSAMLGATIATLAAPLPIALVFDGVLFRKRATGLAEWVKTLDHEQGTSAALGVLTVSYLAIIGVDAVLEYARQILAASVSQRVVYRIRRAAFGNLLLQPPQFFQKQRGGDLLLRLTGDIALLRDMLVPAVLDAAQQALVLVGMLLVIAVISPVLALVAVAIVPLLGLAFVRGSRRLTEVSRDQRKREGKLAAWASQAFHSIAVVQAFGREEAAGEQFGASNRKSMRAGLQATRLESRIARSVDFLTGLGTCAVLILGAFEVRALRLTAGELLIVMAYLRQVYRPLRTFGKLSSRSAKAAASGERVLEVLQLRTPIADAPDAIAVARVRGEIAFENVTVDHGSGRKALDGVTLRIRAGEKVALVGASGAGKSTLLSLVPRLAEPAGGRVLVDGLDVRRLRLRDLRANLAVAFQEPGLLGDTIRENIAFGREGATDAEVALAARRTGVDLIARAKTEGLNAPVSERGASLSGGERQRIALARMALRDAPIWLLDEPFAALDPERQAALEEALEPLLEGRTALLVTHRLDRLEAFDRVVVVADGRIVGDGTPEEIERTSAVFRQLRAAHARSPRRERVEAALAREEAT